MRWRITGLVVAIAVALLAVLVLRAREAAGPDLRQELADLTRDLRGRVDPIPRMKEGPPAVYRAQTLPDPFYPDGRKR